MTVDEEVEILPGVRVWRGTVRVPVADPTALALILSRAVAPDDLDVLLQLLVGAPDLAMLGDAEVDR